MSLRWHLCGVDLSGLWPRLGSGDDSLLQSLHARLDERVLRAIDDEEFDDPAEARAYQSDIRRILDRAVREGVPFPDLREEQRVHVDAADDMARAGRDVYETTSWDWKHGAWFDLHEQLGPKLSGIDKQLLDWLVLGRPVFGDKFGTGWEFYSHLSRDEAGALRTMLASALDRGDCPGPVRNRHFTVELIGWLDDITGRGLEVWVRAN